MEKEYFDGVPESEIEWNSTHDLAVKYLNKMGFDVIEKEKLNTTSLTNTSNSLRWKHIISVVC